jgi:hypothetical protein
MDAVSLNFKPSSSVKRKLFKNSAPGDSFTRGQKGPAEHHLIKSP